MKALVFILSFCVVAGCVKVSSTESAPGSESPAPNTERKPNKSQILKIYDLTDESLNSLQAVNVSPGHQAFDFTFTPSDDMEISLPTMGGKFYLVGCKESDISTRFEVFRSNLNDQLDSPTNFPASLETGVNYVIRATLHANTSCFGVRYSFGVLRTR